MKIFLGKKILFVGIVGLIFGVLWGCGEKPAPTDNSAKVAKSQSDTGVVVIPEKPVQVPKLAPASAPAEVSYLRHEGNLGGDLLITMHLIKQDSAISGCYFYQKVGRPIGLTSHGIPSGVELWENDPDNPGSDEPSGIFTGDFLTSTRPTGYWRSPNTDQQIDFQLQENYPVGATPIALQAISKKIPSCHDTACLSIDLCYPQVKADVGGINHAIEFEVCKHLTGEDRARHPEMTVEKAATALFQEFEELKEGEDGSSWQWSYDINTSVYANEFHVLSLALECYSYSGGAHGLPYETRLNFDLRTGERIRLEDILVPDYQAILKADALKYLKLSMQGTVTDRLSDLGLSITQEEFALPENFYLSQAGLSFIYNPYEIGPYAMGFVEVFLPAKVVRKAMRADGVLASYLH